MKYLSYKEGRFQAKWLSKCINQWGFLGKQYINEKNIYSSFFLMKKKLQIVPMFIFFESLEKIKPIIGIKLFKKRKKKINKVMGVPYILGVTSGYRKAVFWLVRAIKLYAIKNVFFKIFQELYNIVFLNTGYSLKKKKEYYNYALLYIKIKKFKW